MRAAIERELKEEERNHLPTAHRTAEYITAARQRFDNFKLKQPDLHLHRDLQHGWMLPALLMLDECLWGRWNYWCDCCNAGQLPQAPIPRLEFLPSPHHSTRRMLEASLDCIPRHGSWRTWGSCQYITYFLEWLLFGFGHKGQAELPQEPEGCKGASNKLYQLFCLDAILLWPHDYFGSLLAESAYGKKQGFYPTPHHICEFMTRMVGEDERDMRTETVCDPCVGTGRFLLHASNHSLRLYGCDIDATLCKATLVNGYCYAPWLVRPIPWLDRELAALEQLHSDGETSTGSETSADHAAVAVSEAATALNSPQALSDLIAAAAPAHIQARLQDTEHDPSGQRHVAPLLKRRRKGTLDPTQGNLF